MQEAIGLEERGPARVVRLAGGGEVAAHAILIATGVEYRRLEVPGVDRLTGRGIYYGGSRAEALSCRGEPVFIVGGRELGRARRRSTSPSTPTG